MDLRYDTEHVILRESAERFLAEKYDYHAFQRISASEPGWSEEIWRAFAGLGWLGLPFAEEHGGIGGGPVEIAILMEAFGRSLVVEPYLATVVLGGGLVSALGSETQQAEMLPAVAEGALCLAVAHEERGGGLATTARKAGKGYVLSGAKCAVLGAPMARTILVSAKIGKGGLGVFALPAETPGMVVRPYRTVDGARAADIDLVDAEAPAAALLGGNEDAGAAVERVVHGAIAALTSDAVGAMAALVEQTVEYCKTRVQFGQPIAKFQIIQHRLVDMKVKEEEARASALFATLSLDGPADQRARAVSGAKAKVGRAARFVAQAAVQNHGAIGTTEELAVGAYMKRLMAYENLFGSTRHHLAVYAGLIGDPDTAGRGLLLEPAG